MKNIEFESAFLEKVINFDFDRFYTQKIRIVSHLFMWLFFTFLMFLNYYWGYKFNIQSSVLFAIRIALCNIAVFYLLFYLLIPYTFSKRKIIFFVLFLPVLVQVWLLINYYFYYSLFNFGLNLDLGKLGAIIKESLNIPILTIISPKNILAHLFEVLMAVSPYLFVKISFDLSRTYSESLKTNKQIEVLNYEKLVMENKFLLTQLNPHFLFNTLNNLYALASSKSNLTPELILKLSDIMRYTLYEASVETISLEKELDFIENYFDMEKIRYPNDYVVEKSIICDDCEGLKIAPLLTFVFIENAFKYGLKSENPFLKMSVEINKKNVYFAVENDKTLLSLYSKDELSIGIENVKRRLNLLYPDKHSLAIKSDGDRFLVELKIQLE